MFNFIYLQSSQNMSYQNSLDLLELCSVSFRTNNLHFVGYLCGILDVHYGEPWRKYHNFDHIGKMLADAREWQHALRLDITNAPLEVAILFHDIIYDVTRKDNEEASANLLYRVSRSCFLDVNISDVASLIMATTHTGGLVDKTDQFIADLDLLGLSAPYDEFVINVDNIKKEYLRSYTEEEYYHGRMKFLNDMLVRPSIYYLFKDRNKLAKENIIKEMWRLTEQQDERIR
jgi:predicted metal-dependent HD superfamily phosphohydrolase